MQTAIAAPAAKSVAPAVKAVTTPLTPVQVAATLVVAPKVTKKSAKALAVAAGFTSLSQVVSAISSTSPRRAGSRAAGNWQHYVVGQTLAACIAASVKAQVGVAKSAGHTCAVLDTGYALWDLAAGSIKVAPAVVAVMPKA